MKTIHDVPVLLRREIEALMVKPFLDAFSAELGEERTLEIAAGVMAGIAEEAGREYAQRLGRNDIDGVLEQIDATNANGALQVNFVSRGENQLRLDMTHCAYADMYRRLGFEKLGYLLSCGRDAPFYAGFNPKLRMERTKTLMTGGDCCDFCYTIED